MYDFNFMDNKNRRGIIFGVILIFLILLLAYYLYKYPYSNFKLKQAYIKENQEKIDYLYGKEEELENLSRALETIDIKRGNQDLDRLKSLAYLSPDIDKIILTGNYLKIEGTSKSKDLVFNLRDQVKDLGYLNLEIIEVKFFKDDNFYKYIMESDKDDKEK